MSVCPCSYRRLRPRRLSHFGHWLRNGPERRTPGNPEKVLAHRSAHRAQKRWGCGGPPARNRSLSKKGDGRGYDARPETCARPIDKCTAGKAVVQRFLHVDHQIWQYGQADQGTPETPRGVRSERGPTELGVVTAHTYGGDQFVFYCSSVLCQSLRWFQERSLRPSPTGHL